VAFPHLRIASLSLLIQLKVVRYRPFPSGEFASAACRCRNPVGVARRIGLRYAGKPSRAYARPTEVTVAQVLVSSTPIIYRSTGRLDPRQGINLDRSTLADWVGRAAWLLRPVQERLLTALKGSAAVRR
jgi:hypothetical protein